MYWRYTCPCFNDDDQAQGHQPKTELLREEAAAIPSHRQFQVKEKADRVVQEVSQSVPLFCASCYLARREPPFRLACSRQRLGQGVEDAEVRRAFRTRACGRSRPRGCYRGGRQCKRQPGWQCRWGSFGAKLYVLLGAKKAAWMKLWCGSRADQGRGRKVPAIFTTRAKLSHYHTITLSYYHTIILSHYHTIMLSYHHTIILSHYHTITLSYYHTIILSHYHTIMLSYHHTIMLS